MNKTYKSTTAMLFIAFSIFIGSCSGCNNSPNGGNSSDSSATLKTVPPMESDTPVVSKTDSLKSSNDTLGERGGQTDPGTGRTVPPKP